MRQPEHWKKFYVVIALTVIAVGCGQSPNEKSLRDRITLMQRAVEQHDVSALMQSVSSGVQISSPDTGELDREGMRRFVSAVLLTYPKISVVSTIRELFVDGNTARTKVEVVAGAGTSGLPDAVRHVTLYLDWVHDGTQWKIVRARWDRP
jgi:hypothetical protein